MADAKLNAYTHCLHGKPWVERCIECLLAEYRNSLRHHEREVERCKERLTELEAEVANIT